MAETKARRTRFGLKKERSCYFAEKQREAQAPFFFFRSKRGKPAANAPQPRVNTEGKAARHRRVTVKPLYWGGVRQTSADAHVCAQAHARQ
jgi:hypothetical protein